jgi:hypothetical protein
MSNKTEMSTTYLPNLYRRQVASYISNEASHRGIQAEIGALNEGLALSWFKIERNNLSPERVWFKIAQGAFVEHDSLILCQSHS